MAGVRSTPTSGRKTSPPRLLAEHAPSILLETGLKFTSSRLDGCFLVEPDRFRDARGELVKFFQEAPFKAAGLDVPFREDFQSNSHEGVLRGLHFQKPPHEQWKLVYCLAGRIFDVILDIRKGSPTYGLFETFELSGETSPALLLPPGVAHGFLVLSGPAVLVYKVSSEYSPEHDAGIHWQSVGIPWPDGQPLISPRDADLPRWDQFETPFR